LRQWRRHPTRDALHRILIEAKKVMAPIEPQKDLLHFAAGTAETGLYL